MFQPEAATHRRRTPCRHPARSFGIPGFVLIIAPQFVSGLLPGDPGPLWTAGTFLMLLIGLALLCVAGWFALQGWTAADKRRSGRSTKVP